MYRDDWASCDPEYLMLYFDDKKVAWLYKGRYLALTLPPGAHTFSAQLTRLKDKESRIELDLKPGEEYYISFETEPGCKIHGHLTLVPRDQAFTRLVRVHPTGIGDIKQRNLLAANQTLPEVEARKQTLKASADARKQFFKASQDGNLDSLKSLLQGNPALISARDEFGATPLHWAVGTNHRDAAALLLASHADINARIVDSHADVNAWADDGMTALDLAADKGFDEVAELLLANGADPGFVGLNEIVILPVLDSRADKKPSVDLEKIRQNAQKILQHKHYVVTEADSAPLAARGVLTITLTDIHAARHSEDLGGGTPSGGPVVSVSGSLIDQQSGVVRWKRLGSGSYQSAATQPGQPVYGLGMQQAIVDTWTDMTFVSLIPGLARGMALDRAVVDLLRTVPSARKK